MKNLMLQSAALAALIVLSGCSEPWITNTPRSAVEQYLLATTIEKVTEAANLDKYAGKKIFIDYSLMTPQTDKAYLQGRIEMELSRLKCLITGKQDQADILLQPICGVLATDKNQILIGTPPLPIPIPYVDISFVVPEFAIFKKIKRVAYGRIGFNVFDAKTRVPIEQIPFLNASSYFNNYTILLVPFRTHDMDMKNTKPTSQHIEFF